MKFFLIILCLLSSTTFAKARSKRRYINPYPVSKYPVSHYPMIVDLNLNQELEFRFHKRQPPRTLKVVEIREERDSVRQAVRWAKLGVEVNGQIYPVYCENYTLGKRIDELNLAIECLATKGITENSMTDGWGFSKDVRLRLFPDYNDHFDHGEFIYPLEKPMFSGDTQLGNEPTFVDGGEDIADKKIYYHYGVDIGGMEGREQVVSTCDGIVISKDEMVLAGHKNIPIVEPGKSRVTLLDKRGWYHIYSHFYSIDSSVLLGKKIKAGQRIGVLGKEGNSGGWAHLHYDIKTKLANGKWGSINAYPFLWESSYRKFRMRLAAIARPHRIGKMNEELFFHGWFSHTVMKEIKKFEWSFLDEDGDVDDTITGVEAKYRFKTPGIHTVMLKVEDHKGRIDYDFAKVQIADPSDLNAKYPTLHASFSVTEFRADFKVRVFNGQSGTVKINYGDGEDEKINVDNEKLKSGYLDFSHLYKKPGKYIVRFDYLDNTLTKVKWGRTFLELEVVNPINFSLFTHATMPVGGPYRGKLINGKNVSESLSKFPNNLVALSPQQFHFASDQMLAMLEGAAEWSKQNNVGPVCIGDVSRKGGGKLARHFLHQRGLDVDLAYIPQAVAKPGHRKDRFHNKFPEEFICPAGITDNFPIERNISLMAYLVRNFDVKAIWVHDKIYHAIKGHDYKTINEDDKQLVFSILQSDDMHGDHFHVRLWCPAEAEKCLD